MTNDATLLATLLLGGLGVLAGCILDAGPETEASRAASDPGPGEPGSRPADAWINVTDRNASGIRLVTWNGTAPSQAEGQACSNPCHRVPFTVETRGEVGDQLVVSATWDPYAMPHEETFPTGELNVTVQGPDGARLAEGPTVYWSSAAVVDDPSPGRYVAVIEASGDPTSYRGAIHLQDSPEGEDARARELLPDLVVKPVIHVQRTDPGPVRRSPVSNGCDRHERVEHGAENCLRFTTSIGNLGEGPLEVRVSFENATRAVARSAGAPVDAQFTQVIHRADGSTREVPAGQGQFHPAHGHFHKEGVAAFTLYAYDPGNGTRTDLAREAGKSSWCLVDMGLVAPDAGPVTTPAGYPIEGSRNPQTRSNCAAATPTRDMVTGVSRGWYDMYEWNQPDQYVEVTDLPDGTYELVTAADSEGRLVETDPSNNAAGVVFA
jgi:hypothetical protein